MKETIERIPIAKIRESKSNPRKIFNPADEKELIESIKASGIVTPLILMELHDQPEIPYQVVDGARRFRAAKAAGLLEVPSVVRAYTDDEAYEVQLISFAQRVDIDPLDEAAAYEQLRKKKFDIAQIAAKVGKDRSYIAKRLQLASLIAPAKKAFSDGSIALNVAIEISRLDDAQQKDILKKAVDWEWDLEQIRRHIASEILLNLDAAPFKKGDATLVPAAGACIVCPKCTAANMALFDDIKRRCEIHENRVEQEARLRTYGSMLLRLKWPVERKDFEWLVCHLLQSDHRLDQERLGKCLGIDLEKVDEKLGYDDEPQIAALSKLTDQQLVQIAFGIIIEQELMSDPLQRIPGDDRLASICARHGVDRKKIRDEVAKGMESKKPKPPKVEKPVKKPAAKKAKR